MASHLVDRSKYLKTFKSSQLLMINKLACQEKAVRDYQGCVFTKTHVDMKDQRVISGLLSLLKKAIIDHDLYKKLLSL